MKTQMLRGDSREDLAYAAGLIRRGDLVGIPTETVYGLGGNGLDAKAADRIYEAKGRPKDNPFILHIADPKDMESICHSIPETAWLLAERYWPGPLTMILPVKDHIPKRTVAGLSTVGVRCPAHEATRTLIRLSGVPIAAPSANLSGKPSTTTAEHVLHDLDGRIAAIIDGGPCAVGVESTIIDLTTEVPQLLRPGGITPEELLELLGELEVDPAVLGNLPPDAIARAPGMKYIHYSPTAPVTIIDGNDEIAATYIRNRFQEGDAVLCFQEELPLYEGCNPTAYGSREDNRSLSAGLFSALRDLDRPEIKRIFARCPQGGGVAYAVGNRLKKAAGFCIINAEEEDL